jgi:transcriptional antiterminator RfaH
MGLRRQRLEMETQTDWHVIYTKSRQEKLVAEKLYAAGFETYLPLVKIISQWSDRKKVIEKPLFNSYVFIKNIKDTEIVKTFRGVVGFLKYNSKLARVRQHEIDTLRSIIKHGYDVSEMTDTPLMTKGSKVLVMAGPLKGNVGELYETPQSEWFVIHFENIGNSIQVKIPGKLLKKIE